MRYELRPVFGTSTRSRRDERCRRWPAFCCSDTARTVGCLKRESPPPPCAARNELIKEVLRDYGYVEHLGMGVRKRLIGSMRAHNGTTPDLIEDDSRFTVRLWK